MQANLQTTVPQATAAWLFGSAAQGRMNASSDLDIALLLPHGMSWDQKMDWATQLSAQLKREVDLVDFRNASCVLQKEIVSSHHRIFALDELDADLVELHALSQYRAYNERYAIEFERIAQTGKVFA